MSCPSNILRRDSNPRPLNREPPPLTTRPGLPILKFCPIESKLCQILIKLLKLLARDFKNYPKWQKSAKSGHNPDDVGTQVAIENNGSYKNC